MRLTSLPIWQTSARGTGASLIPISVVPMAHRRATCYTALASKACRTMSPVGPLASLEWKHTMGHLTNGCAATSRVSQRQRNACNACFNQTSAVGLWRCRLPYVYVVTHHCGLHYLHSTIVGLAGLPAMPPSRALLAMPPALPAHLASHEHRGRAKPLLRLHPLPGFRPGIA